MHRTLTILLSIALLMVFAGCSSDSSSMGVGDAADVAAGDISGEVADNPSVDVPAAEVEDVTPGDVQPDSDIATPEDVPEQDLQPEDLPPDLPADLPPDAEDVAADETPDPDVQGECQEPAECEVLHGAAGLCKGWECADGSCATIPADQGAACDDGDVCTVTDSCNATGMCVGVPDDCDDSNICTVDSCVAEVGCAYEPVPPEACEDADGAPGTKTCADNEWGECEPFPVCDFKVNGWETGTVNPYIFPAREGKFYVSYVAKEDLEDGANLKLAWVDPGTCTVTEGPFTVNTTPGAVYYWGGQFAASDGVGNFYAVWEAGSGTGMEIAFAASESGTEFDPPTEVVSVSDNGSDPSLALLGSGQVVGMWTGFIDSDAPAGFEYDPFVTVNTDVFGGGGFSTATQVVATPIQDDQTAIVADPEGNIYAAWESFQDGTDLGGNVYVAMSQDGGATFGPKVKVNDVASKANVGKGQWMAFGNGNLYIVWSDSRDDYEGDVFLDVAPGGTINFGIDIMVNDNTYRYQEDPSVVVGEGDLCNGSVYVVWQDLRSNSSYDIYGAKSSDAGLSFEANQMMNPVQEGDQMNPAVGVDMSCVVGTAWRDSTTNNKFDIKATFLPLW